MAQKDFFSTINGSLGSKEVEKGGTSAPTKKQLAWRNQKDSFFSPIEVDANRYDGLFPYRLLVIDVSPKKGPKNKVVGGEGVGDVRPRVVKNKSNTGGVQFSIEAPENQWIFTLPITPQQLSITDQFAINTTATMRGVVEEHNGVKFKMISASGTTGIWPTRDQASDPPTPGKGLTLFGGTLAAARDFGSSIARLTNTILGKQDAPKTPQPKEVPSGQEQTGYFQALLLQQFLEQYAMAKKDPKNKGWRLVFDCPKTNESFVVTPVQYSVTRSQRSPGEFMYNMQFKAWKRIEIGGTPRELPSNVIPVNSNFFQAFVTAMDNARSAMSAALNVVKAVRADVAFVFDQVRKVTLLAKDLGGLVFAVSDLPNQIGNDITAATKKRSADLAQSESLFEAAFKDFGKRNRRSQGKIRATVGAIKSNRDRNEGVSDEEIEAGLLGLEARDSNQTSSLNQIFENPEANFDFLNALDIDSLELTPQQRIAIEDEIELNSLLSIEEVKEVTQELQNLILGLTNNFGAGDSFFSEVFGRPEPKFRSTAMTLEEFELITTLEEAVLNLNIFTATRQVDDDRRQSSLEYVGGLADDSEIPFVSDSTAKILAPVPFGLSLEQISARYLGDPDRYNEIITLNNLRSPYIDEDGFSYSFLSNGDGRQFNIASNDNLYVGQKVRLFSSTIPTFTRKITAIEKITDENFLITVDGTADLSLLTTADAAKIKAFLPGTVNSQNQIYIPSTEAVTEEARTYDIPFLKDDTLTGLSKIDWLLDENGDLIVNSFGEVGLANGTTNLIQALKMKVTTQKGSLLSNPEFGLGLKPGVNVTEVDIENVLKDLRDMVLQDPRFEGVENIEMNILPPEVSLTINARLANGRGIFPINFTV